MARAANLVFIGETAVGKTGLATGILIKALENGYRGLFVKAQDLFDEMLRQLADRSSRRLVNRLLRIDVLLIDELGYLNLRPEQYTIFFNLCLTNVRTKWLNQTLHHSADAGTRERETRLRNEH